MNEMEIEETIGRSFDGLWSASRTRAGLRTVLSLAINTGVKDGIRQANESMNAQMRGATAAMSKGTPQAKTLVAVR